MIYSVVILCAGQGKRTGLSYNKMFYEFHNQTVYEMTLAPFLHDQNCKKIIVVTQESERDDFRKLSLSSKIEFVNGGKERQDSVYSGLKQVSTDYVLIHDGARPYLKQKYIDDLLEALKNHKACLLMVPCKDTIKKVINGKIMKTYDRSCLMQAQTPQAFHTNIILSAYQKGLSVNYLATDDAQMVEMFSHEEVYAVMGDYENKKITTSEDLR